MPDGVAAVDRGWRKAPRLTARLPRLLRDVGSHPAWLLLFVFGRLPRARRIATRLAAVRSRPSLATATEDDPLTPDKVEDVVARLCADGIVTGLRLPAEIVAQIRAYAEANTCFGGPAWKIPFAVAEHAEAERCFGQSLLVASLPDPDRNCPAVAELLRNRWVHAIAAEYFGARPKIIDVRLWWSFPSKAPSRTDLSLAAQNSFHFDLSDWQQLNFFFYLLDVDEQNGPHIYVRGSHKHHLHPFTLFLAKPDDEIVASYRTDAIQPVTGPAGSGFVEDSFGYHTGTSVNEGGRLMLELSFGIISTTRRRPFGDSDWRC
jgi:hypothetical protein